MSPEINRKPAVISFSAGMAKRTGSVAALLLLILGLLYQAVRTPEVSKAQQTDNLAQMVSEEQKEGYEQAEKELLLWYHDKELTDYFTACAVEYYEETGTAVEVKCVDNLEYLENIYKGSMEETEYPDVYLLGSDSLGRAYLYGLAAENTAQETGMAEKAIEAASYQGTMYGYPLTFNTPVFVYAKDSFSETPASIQSIIDYAAENEMGNGIANLIEWNINDEFYDFAFVGDCMEFSVDEENTLSVQRNEELYAEKTAYLEELKEIITLEPDQMSAEQVIKDFNEGATASAIVDSNDLDQITLSGYGVAGLPALNDTLMMKGASVTELLVVNKFSDHEKEAAEFAAFVTGEATGSLEELSGHFPVREDAITGGNGLIAYQAYEQAVCMPAALNADDFWKALRQEIVKIWSTETV